MNGVPVKLQASCKLTLEETNIFLQGQRLCAATSDAVIGCACQEQPEDRPHQHISE